MDNFVTFLSQNFWHVLPILAAGAFGLVIILERTHALVWDYAFPYSDAFFEKIRYMVLSNRIGEAVAFSEQLAGKPVVRVVREGLLRAHMPDQVIEHGLQIAVSELTEKVQARTGFLTTIANVATLLGLFGTILGLIESFEAIGAANAQERAMLLSSGISIAMNATMLGLGVAIPCMVAYAFLINKTNRLVSEIDLAAVRTLDLIKQAQYATDVPEPEYGGHSRRQTRAGI